MYDYCVESDVWEKNWSKGRFHITANFDSNIIAKNSLKPSKYIVNVSREIGDNGLFITQVPKSFIIMFSYSLA